MNSLKSYILNEGEIGDLKGVRFIRHYTTLEGLLHILNDGKIKANESEGDEDWSGYDIGPSKVVSFHDVRTDPEIEEICYCNDNEITLWETETLGIHQGDICAFIEYNFDIMPWNIKQHATYIKILEHYVKEFVEIWNKISKYKGYKDLKEIEYKETNINLLIYYSNDEILSLLNRKNLKGFTKSEEKKLLDASIKDDKTTVLKMLKEHGCKPNEDAYNPFYKELIAWEDHNFLEYVIKRFTKKSDKPINLEIRIACDVPIGIRGCTIHFFDGMAKAILDKKPDGNIYFKVLNELSKRNNVEIYEPWDDYSLIEN